MTSDHDPRYIYVVKPDGRNGKAKLYRTPINKLTAQMVHVERKLPFGCKAVMPRSECHFSPEDAIAAFSEYTRWKIRDAGETIRQLTKTLGSVELIDPKVADDSDY
jgi:hypothetical protein